jgi:hypothetical protein
VTPDKLRSRIAPFLEPDEKIAVVVPAETGLSLAFVLVSSLLRLFTKRWLIVRTDRRILLLTARAYQVNQPRRLNAEFPLDAPVEFGRSGLGLRLRLGGKQYRVSGAFRDEVAVLAGQREPERELPMNVECLECGVMNFEAATECRKCAAPLAPASG